METIETKITCPECGHEIDVNEVLYQQVDKELKKKYKEQLSGEMEKVEEKLASLEKERLALVAEKKAHDEKLTKEVEDKIAIEKKKLKADMKLKLEKEVSQQIETLQDELNEKSEKLKEHNKLKSDLAKLQREKDELKETIEAETEKRLTDTLAEERNKIQLAADEKSEMKIKEKEHLISQLEEQLKIAQRKAQQGSMQSQGEVQEIAIEEWLTSTFPFDSIEEIKKGAKGGDCIQIVNTRTRRNCGSIYYESKRTKAFQPTWIEKFKADIRERDATIGVLVTEQMPSDMDRMGFKDGIWICTFEEFKGLCAVLRETVIALDLAVASQENKEDKMEILYSYLTSNDFKRQVEAIVEGFDQMRSDLEKEKRAMASLWKQREKQIDKVITSTTNMYGSIKGIAGSAIESVPLLELPDGDDEASDF